MAELCIDQNDVRKAVKGALEYMTEEGSGFYAPLVERFPLVMDWVDIPPAVQRNLKAHHAPACTDGDRVYVDIQEMLNTIVLAVEYRKKELHVDWLTINPTIEARNILAHEYTHILCQHTRQGQEFNRKSKKERTPANLRAFQTACEIEANRGYMVDPGASVYSIAVTEAQFPETKEDDYLPQIYETLRKKFGKSMKDLDKEGKDGGDNSKGNNGEDAQQQGEGSGTGVPDEASDEQSDNEKGNSNNNGNQTDNRECEGDGGFERSASEEADGSERGTGSCEGGNQPSSTTEGVEEGSEELSEAQKSVIRRMMETDMALAEEKLTSDDLLPHDDEDKNVEDDIMLSLGLGEGDEGFIDLSPAGKLEYVYKRWKANNVKKELAKMKGVIAGTISRERVRTYSRQSRKQGEDGLMMKGQKRSPRSLPKILLAMDSSGSMNSATMKQIASAIADIFDTCGRPTQGCYICKHTSRVSDVLPMKEWKKVAESFYAGGGNDFSKVLEKALELNVDVVLNLGDGQDYVNRDKAITKRAVERGIEWYDCNVVNHGYYRWKHIVSMERKYESYHKTPLVKRKFIDLTGGHPSNEN